MDIFGIGPMELVLILIIALIVMGPNDMAKAGRTIGRTLRAITTSQTWQVIRLFMKEMQTMPNRLMREAQFDDIVKDVSKELKQPIAEIKAVTDETTKSLSSSAWANPDLEEEPDASEVDEEIEQRTIAPPNTRVSQHTESTTEAPSENIDENHA
jgi:sec-independent protein translocase protein TatB